MAQNTEVHWEPSKHSEACKLPLIQNFMERHSLKKVSCSGCTLGLRTKDGKQALCKAWSIASKNPHLLQRLDLQCQGNHPRGKCERGEAAHTSPYTQPFVRKVADALSECEPWHRILEDQHAPMALCGSATEEAQVGSQEAPLEEISEEEKESIEQKLQHIHQNTGHSSIKQVVHMLETRGVHPRVLQVAKQWKRDIFAHRKRMDPRKFVHLETAPQKWERVQMDMATWVHPQSKTKYHAHLGSD